MMQTKKTLVCLCLAFVICSKMASSRYLFNAEDAAGLDDFTSDNGVEKRQMDSQGMAFMMYCLTRGRYDIRCRKNKERPINIVTQ